MKLYLSLTRRRLLLMLALIIVMLLIAAEFYAAQTPAKNADTNERRIEFAAERGYTIDTASTVTKSRIPDNADGELKSYRGCPVRVYRYPLADNTADLDLTVYRGRVIAARLTKYRNEEQHGKNQTGSLVGQSTPNDPK